MTAHALQEKLRAIRDLEVLGRITNKIFLITHLDEATALIEDYLSAKYVEILTFLIA